MPAADRRGRSATVRDGPASRDSGSRRRESPRFELAHALLCRAGMTSRCHALIDLAYDRFVADLPLGLRALARQLPQRCRLSPLPEVPWSRVFNNIAVLGFPALLFGETSRPVPAEVVDAAVRAHLFAMIDAFAQDRIDDGQITVDATLHALLREITAARDLALAELVQRGAVIEERGAVIEAGFVEARRETSDAAMHEQAVFVGSEPAGWTCYREVSAAKQRLAFPATLAGASAAGFSAADLERVRALLLGCTLGLQYRDDVVDWLDDRHEGGAWAVALLGEDVEDLDDAAVAERLHAHGVLVQMLEMSTDEFARAAAAARELGATSLSTWAAGQAVITAELAQREASDPGHALAWERARVARRTAGQAELVRSAS